MTSQPRVRRAVILALALVVVLAATLGVRLWSNARLDRALTRLDEVGGGLDYAALAPKRVEPRRENAAFWLRTGADLLSPDSEFLKRRVDTMGSPWTDADVQSFEQLRADNVEARSMMGRAADLERSSFEIEYGRGASAEIPNFLNLIQAARFLAVESDFHQQRGELPAAATALHLIERLATVQRAEPMLISNLTAAATERLYLDRLEAMLQTTRDIDTLRRFTRDLDRLDAGMPMARAITFDVAVTYPAVLRDPGAWPEETPLPRTQRIMRSARPALRVTGLDRLMAALFVETGARAIQSSGRPVTTMTTEQYEREVLDLESLPAGLGTMARQIVPAYLNAIQRDQWTRDARALARLAVELSLSRAGHGSYPTALQSSPVGVATGETATYSVLPDGGVEIAFPEAESTWAREKEITSRRKGVVTTATFNLRWRLPA